MSRSENVWIVDDDRSIRWVLEKALQQEGMATQSFDIELRRISAIHPLIITYSGVATRRLRAPITALKKLRPALPLIAVLL